MNIHARAYQHTADYQRVSDFLAQTYALNQRPHNWCIERWDGWCYSIYTRENPAWEARTHLWETDTGELVGVVHPEGKGDAFLEIHPDYRHLEGEMLDWAEQHLAQPGKDNPQPRLNLYIYEYDSERQTLLAGRGYQKGNHSGSARWRDMREPIPDAAVPAGYTVRQLHPETDLESRCAASNSAFNNHYVQPDGYRLMQTAPVYDPALDLIAVDSEETVVSFTIVWWDALNRIGMFEPVGTHADYQRRGLARAVMCEGLRLLQQRQAIRAYVGVGPGIPANRLYESIGFIAVDRDYHWHKKFS